MAMPYFDEINVRYYDIPTAQRRRDDPTTPPQRARILDPNWVYVPANETNVQATWLRHGWVKPVRKPGYEVL